MLAGKLEELELFRKTFGKNFASRSYDLNVSRVYTNEVNEDAGGYYSEKDHSITICASGINGELLSIEDIKNSEALQETALHESAHGILEKSKKECKKLGIKSGTGMLEIYGKDKELGRGKNEGLTNWIVSKTGIRITRYLELTNVIRQIELAIGPEKTMKLGKGDIRNKIPKLLQMGKDECKEFIAKTDSFYDYGTKIKEEERAAFIFIEAKKLMEKEGKFANYEDAENNIASHLEERNKLVRESIDVLLDIEDTIYTKYFKKEFDELTSAQTEIPDEKLLKFIDLRNFMHNYGGENLEASVIDFQKKIDQMKRDFLDEKAYMLEAKAKMGTLSISEFSEARELFERCGGSIENQALVRKIAKAIDKENSNGVVELINQLSREDRLQEINDYQIMQVKEGDRNKSIFIKDGKVDFASFTAGITSIKAGEKVQDIEKVIDFTLDIEEDIVYVNKFLELQEDIRRNNPDATISIVGREILVNDGINQTVYIMQEGEITKANIKSRSDMNGKFALRENEKGQSLLEIKPKSRFSKMILNMRRRLFRNTGESIIYNSKEETSQEVEGHKELQAEFKDRISNMSNYEKLSEIEEPNEETIESEKEISEGQDTKGDR